MKKILYIHGFGSAGSTGTATIMRHLLYDKDVRVVSPDVPVSPLEALSFLRILQEQEQPDLIIAHRWEACSRTAVATSAFWSIPSPHGRLLTSESGQL